MIDYRGFIKRLRTAAGNGARKDEGSALVEMAVSTILVMTVFLGVFELCMAAWAYNGVNEVARECSRWAMVRGSMCSTYTPNQDHCGALASDIQDHAKAIAPINWSQCTTSKPCVTVSWMKATTVSGKAQTTTTWASCSTPCADPGNLVIVKINYPYAFNVPFVKTFKLTLGSQAQMVISQ